MDLTPQNVTAWHNHTQSQHSTKRDEYSAKGFRTLSLSIYGSVQNPLFAAVMVKRPILVATKQFGPTNQSGIQQSFDDMAAQGFGPYILSATGPANSAVFVGVFTPMSSIPLTRLDLTGAEFAELNAQQQGKGRILLWADAFGTASDTRYTAIWGPNPSRQAWSCDGIAETGSAYKARFDALVSVWCRQTLVSITPGGRYLAVFADSTMGSWTARKDLTSSEYQDEYNKATAKGLMPICVSGSGSGSSVNLAAIFADRDNTDVRTFRSQGPVSVASIDSAIEAYVKDHNLRGVGLAITKGTRLVYAKGYTYGEPSPTYPDVMPTTVFRQASVSKTFAAVAMWKLIQQGSATLNTKVQVVLNLNQPDGSAPKDSRWADIRIRHLLESTSGIKQGLIWWGGEAVKAFGGQFPVTHQQLARYATTHDLTGSPGDANNVSYGNFDYFLLGLVIAKLAGTTTFEQALNNLVLMPLGMTKTRQSRTLITAQASDEARHHMRVFEPKKGWPLFPLQIGSSVKGSGTVPAHYGAWDYELLDGCGGLSSSVVDVARLVAMFNDRSANPVLNSTTLDSLFDNAVNATNSLDTPDVADPKDKAPAHGYHGFDGATAVDAAKHVYRASKGGWLPGQGTEVIFRTGGYGFILAQNGNLGEVVKTEWLDPVNKAAKAQAWGPEDLFTDYGMTPLSPSVGFAEAPDELSVEVTGQRPMSRVADSLARQAPARIRISVSK